MPEYNDLIYDIKDHIAVITLNRPKSLNAWYKAMNDELKRVAEDIDCDPDVRVAVITAPATNRFAQASI